MSSLQMSAGIPFATRSSLTSANTCSAMALSKYSPEVSVVPVVVVCAGVGAAVFCCVVFPAVLLLPAVAVFAATVFTADFSDTMYLSLT